MKLHTLLLAACGATLSLAAHAQTTTDAPAQAGRMGRGGNRMAEMTKELNLTADQQTKVEAIMRDGMGQRPSGPPTQAEREAMQARRAEMETKLKAVLTPEQFTKYEAMRQQQRGQRPMMMSPASAQ